MYITYKTTNKITGEYYIGSHKTDNPNDDYLGSGKKIKESIKRYGKKAHIKEILGTFKTREESLCLEHKLIKEKRKNDKNCINLSGGGFSFDYINENLTFDRSAFAKMASHEYSKELKIKNMNEYYKNPKRCPICGEVIEYNKKTQNIFCSKSCSATYNNEERNIKNNILYFCCKCGKRLRTPSKKDGTAMCRECFLKNPNNANRIRKPTEKRIMILNNKNKIKEMHESGISYRKIGEKYGVSGNYIKNLLKDRLEYKTE